MRVHYPKLGNIVHTIYLALNVFIASEGSDFYILLTEYFYSIPCMCFKAAFF